MSLKVGLNLDEGLGEGSFHRVAVLGFSLFMLCSVKSNYEAKEHMQWHNYTKHVFLITKCEHKLHILL